VDRKATIYSTRRPEQARIEAQVSDAKNTARKRMQLDPSQLGAEQAYRLITGIVVPRPIAWVSTLSGNGVVNLAPFSAFTFVSPKPPMLAISVGHKAGVYKDTAHNILSTEEFVVHIADTALMAAVHESSAEFPADVSEVEHLGLATIASETIKVPRVAAAPIAMECRFRQCIEFGETRSRLLVGEVLVFHIRDDLLQNGKIETETLDPIARIAGPRYARLGEIISMKPVFQTSKSAASDR
jgi:flavin reductase (DIM6/NTAB) family NADH-FMN oxidoreductase RutF